MNEGKAEIKFRIDRNLKRKAKVLGINFSKVSRAAIRSAVDQREKSIGPIDLMDGPNNRKEAAKLFQKLRPVWVQVLDGSRENLIKSADKLYFLKQYLAKIPDRYIVDYARFLAGGEDSLFVLEEYLQ